MKRVALIPEWRLMWRFNSVRAAALLAFWSMVQADVLPLVQAKVPAQWWPWVTAGVALLIIVFRVLSQPGVLPVDEADPAAPTEGPP